MNRKFEPDELKRYAKRLRRMAFTMVHENLSEEEVRRRYPHEMYVIDEMEKVHEQWAEEEKNKPKLRLV